MAGKESGKKLPIETTAEAYLELLRALGVEYLFGNPGTDFASIIDALAKFAAQGKSSPRPIAVPHEFCAVSMADGYAAVSGMPQVVMVHTTVGTANALGALINASRARIPLILAAGRTPVTESGLAGSRDNHIHWAQESFDQGAMVREYVKWDYELKNFSQLESVVRRAFTIAMSEPKGPVYLTLPREVLAETHAEFELADERPAAPAAPPYPDPRKIEEIADLLAGAEEPLIITRSVGSNPRAMAALTALADSFALPVIEFPFPEYANFPGDHPLHLGFDPARRLQSADVVLVIESDVPWFPGAARPDAKTRVVHIGTDPLHSRYPIWGFPSDLALAAEPEGAMKLLTASLTRRRSAHETKIAARYRRAQAEHDKQRADWEADARGKEALPRITLEWVAFCLNRLADEQTLIVNEYDLRLQHFTIKGPGSYLSHSPAGGLGWGVGAALGAKLAAPEKTVVAVVGDGAYLFSVPSACHMVAAMEGLPVLVIVCDNGGWGAPQRATRALHPKGWAVRTENFPLTRFTARPAYEMFVQAYGGYGARVERPGDLPEALAKALRVVKEEKRQAVLHVVCESIVPSA